MKRKAKVDRKTHEVKVNVEVNIDGTGKFDVKTGIPFFNHMLNQMAKHGYFDFKVKALGDIEVDFHHTVEDVGITLGEAFAEAIDDKKGISRYGHAIIPFDETLVTAAVDLSGRPHFVYKADIPKCKVGDFDSELVEEFFKSFANALCCNLHIELRYGSNVHHNIEAMFKAVAKALDSATKIDPRSKQIPSTKGKL